MPWYEDDAEPNADMCATADESREQIIAFYHRVWTHSDVTINSLDLDAVGDVPHWPKDRSEVTLHQILVHMTAETSPGGTSTGVGFSASRARQTQAPRRGERSPRCYVPGDLGALPPGGESW